VSAPTDLSNNNVSQNLGQRGIRIRVEFLYYLFIPFKWYPYPFFYRLEGARYLVE
jgi:hypothetical protein